MVNPCNIILIRNVHAFMDTLNNLKENDTRPLYCKQLPIVSLIYLLFFGYLTAYSRMKSDQNNLKIYTFPGQGVGVRAHYPIQYTKPIPYTVRKVIHSLVVINRFQSSKKCCSFETLLYFHGRPEYIITLWAFFF